MALKQDGVAAKPRGGLIMPTYRMFTSIIYHKKLTDLGVCKKKSHIHIHRDIGK